MKSFRKALIALVSASFLVGPMAGPVAAAACGIPASEHLYIQKHADNADVPGTYMEYVSGQVTVRDLDASCNAVGLNAILPANLQRGVADGTLGGNIWQLGYAQLSGDSGMRFVYAYQNNKALYFNSWVPQIGTTYQFEIGRGDRFGQGSSDIVYRLTNKSSGAVYMKVLDQNWYGTMDLVWWGGERGASGDEIGPDVGEGVLIMRYMAFMTEVHTQSVIRTEFGSPSEVIDTVTDPNQHAHVVDWAYNEDGIQFESHP